MHPCRAKRISSYPPGFSFLRCALPLLCAAQAWATTYYWNRNEVLTNDKDFSRAYNWTSNADGTGTLPASTQDDDFTNDALGSSWTFRDNDNDGTTGSYSLTTNTDQLTLVGRGADVWLTNNQYVAVYRSDIHGNFDVTVKVVSQTNTDPYAKAGIMVANDITNLANGGYAVVAMTPGHGVNFNYDGSGNIGELENGTETSSLSYPVWVRLVKNGLTVAGYYRTSTANAWTQVGSTVASQTTSLKSNVAVFSTSHNTGSTCTAVFDDFTGGGPIATTGLDLSLNGTGANSDASATLGSGDLSVNSLDLTGYTGTLDFGGKNGLFSTYYDNMDLTGTSVARVDTMVSVDWGAATPAAGLGADQWTVHHEGYVVPLYSETYTFYCKSDDGCRLWVNNQLVVDKWQDQGATEWSGAVTGALTAGTRYSIVSEMYDNGGGAYDQIKWSSASQTKEAIPSRSLFAGKLTVTGTGTCVNMPSGTVTAENGWIDFAAASGTQTFVPRSGQNMPNILHSGAGTLQIATNALSTIGLFQSAGTFDFNSLNVSTVASGTNRGDFQVWNGGTSSFANLGGRTIAVAGNASISGSYGSLVNLNPGSGWNLNVTGRLTADYVTLQNSTAATTAGLAYKSVDGGSNTGWTINTGTFYWNRNDIITTSTNFQRTYNWTSNADGTGFRPEAAENNKFAGQTLGSGWYWLDRDNDESVGSYSLSGGQLVMATRGGDVYTGTNEFVTLYRTDATVNGDYFDVTVKIMAQTNTDGWGKAGIIMANNLSTLTSGGYAFVAITPGNNISFQADVSGNIGEIDGGGGGGTLAFPIWLRLVRNSTTVSAYWRTNPNGAWTQSNSTVTPQGLVSGTSSQIGLFVCSPNTGSTMSVTFDDFEAGGMFLNANDNNFSFNGTGAGADANSLLAGTQNVGSTDFTGYSGTLDFTGGTLQANSGNVTFIAGMGLTGAGSLTFTGSGAQTFTIKSGATYANLSKSGAGTLTLASNDFSGSVLTVSGGTLDMGSGRSHTVTSVATSGSGTLTFNNSALTVTTGNCDFSGLGTLNASSGSSLTFSLNSAGTQVFTPKGAASTHPSITKAGVGTLQLSTNALTTRAFTVSGGTIDFGGRDVTVNNSGNFAINNGTSSTVANLGGSTLTVAGTTSLNGTLGNSLNINPGSTWTVNSTGALTASYASIANSNAAGSAGTGVASYSTNGGGNTHWNFPSTDYSAWNYSSQINFNTTSTGANITSNLGNFPLLVRLDSNNFIFTQADIAGKDIRFMDPDGNGLSYEIERWDATKQKAEIWVLVPQVDGNSDRDFIKMFWGNSAATTASSGSAVFLSGMNWAGDWHMKQNGAQPSLADASAAANTGTAQGVANGDTALADIGYGYKLDGSSKYAYTATSFASPNTFTAGVWFKTTSNSGGKLIGLGGSQTGASGNYDRQLWMDNTGKLNFGVNPSTTKVITSTIAYNDGAWHLGVIRLGTSGEFLYVDGALAASDPTVTTGQAFTGYWRFGYDNLTGWSPLPTSHYLNGTLDEAFVNTAELSADWIKFAYMNQKQNGTSLTYVNSALGTWSYSSKVYVNTTATGANITSDVANFPMLIRLTQGNFDFSQARNDGGDLRFADSTGALLPYELDRFDATNKVAEVWVLIPTVKAKNNSQWFRMYWGKANSSSLSSSASVFQVSNGFVSQYHMNESSGTAKDATSYGNNGTFNGNVPNLQNGYVGKAHLFDGNGDYISLASNSSYDFSANDRFTLSAWVNRSGNAVAGLDEGIVSKHRWTAGEGSFVLYNQNSANGFTVVARGASEVGISSNYVPTNGTWYHVVGVADGSKLRIYVNGLERANTAYSDNVNFNSGSPFKVGETDDDGAGNRQYWNGYIDEPSVSNVARSADWIKLSYESQSLNNNTVTVGARPSDFAKSTRFNFNTTSSGANTSTNVTNVPILVRLSSANFDFTSATTMGTDLQFIDRDGTYLYHDLVDWDKANQTGKVWVRVPQVDGNSTQDYITLYYGCATCTASPYDVSDSVWSGYKGVWHLRAGDENQAKDVTRYRNHLNYALDVPSSAGITTALSPYFDGGSGSYASIASPAGGELDFGTGDFTVSAWMNSSQAPAVNVWPLLMNKESATDGYALVNNPSGAAGGKPYFEVKRASTYYQITASAAKNDGIWHQLTGKKTATQIELFVDGVSQGTTAYTNTTSITNATDFSIGNSLGGANPYKGYLNEVNAAATAFSADYIKLMYENQKAATTLFSTTTFTTASFQKTKVFRLNTTPSGANVPGDVYNFPLLLRITGNSDVVATPITDLTQSAGQDIRFLDGDGVTWLDYQIERWSPSLDSAEVWVRLPRIRGNSSSDFITMYYQQASGVTVPDGQCASCVFSTSNGYQGVWQLSEETAGTGTTGVYKDITANANNGTDFLASTTQTGLVGKGHVFGGSDYVSIPDNASLKPTQVSVSTWVNFNSLNATTTCGGDPVNYQTLLFKRNSRSDAFEGYILYQSATAFGFATTTAAGVQTLALGNTTISTGTWYNVTGTYDGSNMRLYVNGQLQATVAKTAALDYGTRPIFLGRTGECGGAGESNWDSYLNGILDQATVSSVVRDSNWVKLAYQNQRRDATPLFNPSTADFQKSKKYVFNTTRTGANVMNDVNDFPLLVRVTDANAGILDQVQGSGTSIPADIRFLDGDGKTWLNYTVERWDRGVDSGEVWVRIPKVDGNSDHDFITMYYQQASGVTVPDGQCATCVFDTTLGFASTWHLNNSLSDATVNANTGTNQGSVDGEGVAASGRSFSGTAQYATFGNGNGLKNIATSISVEAWVKTSLSAASSPISVLRYDGKFTALQYSNGSNTARSAVWTPALNTPTFTWNGQFDDNTWHHYVSEYNAFTGQSWYRDGVLYATNSGVTGSLPTTNSAVFALGGTESGGELWTGKLDEVRVSSVLRDSNYVKLSYQTQRRVGNVFWNNRVSPNNKATFTAQAISPGNIALTWTTPVSDSSNADSVGIWVKYTGYPDSATGAAGTGSASHVVTLGKTDSAYTYPATYTGTYYFSLAVRNTNGKWSPFTSSASDTANLGMFYYADTVYVDSAIGSNSYTCSQALNPATPKLTVTSAEACETNATDTLVVRVMSGTYATDNQFDSNVKPIVVTSFDNNSRAVFNGSGTGSADGATRNWTLFLFGGVSIRNLDIKCATNNNSGVYVTGGSGENGQAVEGCRIYNDGNLKHDKGIELEGTANTKHISNNLIYQPTTYGIYSTNDNSYNIVNNVIVGTGAASSKGLYVNLAAYAADATISNNIFYNWDYGLQTTTANIGSCASNLFFGVTSGREVTTTTCTGSLIKDPLFANTNPTNPNAFKLLPGSPAIDAGSTVYGSGAESVPTRTYRDLYGTARPVGSAPDIGLYEGTGFTANPAGEFDSLIASSTATTVTVYNSKWKVVFDKAKGGGISEFYDQTAPATNLLASGTVLFDDKVTATSASSQSTIAPAILEQGKSRVVVKQRFGYSASLDVNFYYTLYPSGHIFVQVEYVNLSAGTLTMTTVDYTVKVGTATSAYTNGLKNGYGYLTTATRDVLFSVTTPLDDGASSAETWTGSATSGASGNLVFNTGDMINPSQYFHRYHHFLLYIGDASLDAAKATALHADVTNPSALVMSSGSLIHERSWQDQLLGHWTFDEGAGTVARDKSINQANNGTITGAKFVSGKINAALTFASTDMVTITDNNALEAGLDHAYMFWFKPNFASMGTGAYIFSKGQSSSDGWSFRRNTSASTVKFRMGSATANTPTLTDGVWTHIAGVLEGNDGILRLYVNGVLVDVSSSAATVVANATDVHIGENDAGTANNRFVGDIDDVRIYNIGVQIGDIQSIYNRGFTQRYGDYILRADNNNRIVATINSGAACLRAQPAFQIDNWFGPATPKFVYLNGVRLNPNTDFSSSLVAAKGTDASGAFFGSHMLLQLNENLTGADQTLFIDDDDSTGYLGTGGQMKSLAITATANDKMTIQNFSGSTFGSASSGQWYLELDLNGWATPTASPATNGYGEFNVWKAAAINPSVAVSGGTNQVGLYDLGGRTLSMFQMDYNGTNYMNASGYGYAGPANISYTLVDSSSTRLSLTLSAMTYSGNGNVTMTKRWTVYPTGRIFGSYQITASNRSFNRVSMWFQGRYDSGLPTPTWSTTTANATARYGLMGGDLNFHSFVGGLLSIKSAGATVTAPASMDSAALPFTGNNANNDYYEAGIYMKGTLFESGDVPVTMNFAMDLSKDFTDSATADSLMKDIQTPAVLTAITGTRTTTDALDFNADNFAEGDGAYTYAAAGGIAHFKFVNSVTSFNPAFRINTWTQGTLPEVVILDNQILTRGYQYNIYLNTAGNGGGELVMQFNKTLTPGTHVFYISHKSGLAVTLRSFEAKGGDGVDTLQWTTESEFENLGYHVYRRIAPGAAQLDSSLAAGGRVAGAGIANALMDAARTQVAAKAAAKLAKAQAAAGGDSTLDTLASLVLTPEELKALGYERITPRLIAGAKGGSSASTINYTFIDRNAGFGMAYEYLLEAWDFNGGRVQYGPRVARPGNSLVTELESNYPNPFNPITTLRFSLKEKTKVSLIIYDGNGRVVRELVRPEKAMLPGKYRLIWDAKNEGGFEVPSGQYFYRFTAGRYVKTRKMVLVK